jgi:hypothetical protein
MERDTRITFRLSQEDRLLLESRAKGQGLSVSKYLRHLLLNDSGKATYDPKNEASLKRYFADINRYGNNVNQIVKSLNNDSKRLGDVSTDLHGLLLKTQEHIIAVKEGLTSLVRQIRI